MTALLRHRSTAVWLALVVATAVSWWLGAGHGFGEQSSVRVAGAVVLVVAFAKVRFIGLDFMELRAAPLWLRAAFEAWVLVVGTAVTVLHLLA